MPEQQLLLYIDAFRSICNLEASFRDSQGQPPTLSTLTLFYDLVTASPRALVALRRHVDALLRRPGSSLQDSDGGWVLILLECPLLLSKWTPDATARLWLVSRLVGVYACSLGGWTLRVHAHARETRPDTPLRTGSATSLGRSRTRSCVISWTQIIRPFSSRPRSK